MKSINADISNKTNLKRFNFYTDLSISLFKNKGFIISLFTILTIFFAGLILKLPRFEFLGSINLEKAYLRPSYSHIFGTNKFGQDMFFIIMTGCFNTICFSLIITIINIIIGTLVGALWGSSNKLDFLVIFIKGILDNIPMFFVFITFLIFFGNSYVSLFFIIIIFGWINVACMVRNNLIHLRNKDYNIYSKSINTPFFKRLIYNYFPSLIPIVFNYFAISIPQVISIEVTISYLAFPINSSSTSLGTIIYSTIYENNCMTYPHLLIIPLLMLIIINLCVYTIGKTISKHSIKEGDLNVKS